MTVPELIHVKPERVRAVWGLLRDRIATLGRETGEPWMPEDVFNELVSGSALLFVANDGDGFVVLTTWSAPYARDLHVWIACNDTVQRAADYLPQIKAIARRLNCWRVVFESPRKWERALPGAEVRYLYTISAGD